MTDSKTPEWMKEEADKVGEDIYGRHERGFIMWPLISESGTPLRDAISQALLSAYERGGAEREWQPIETAPKDGRRVLCWNHEWSAPESGCLYGMVWAANGLAADKGGWKYQPTNWMPLPAPPAKENDDER